MKLNTADPGRFTVLGGTDVEKDIRDVVAEVSAKIAAATPKSQAAGLLLVGGYGRGEGGVVVEKGREKAHNNLDFMLLTTPAARINRGLRTALDLAVDDIRNRTGFGIDIGMMPVTTLMTCPKTVFYYDFFNGHKLLAGPRDLMKAFPRPEIDRINPDDVLNLLVNRGTLLVINQVLSHDAGRDAPPTTIVRHAMKAVIGYGDALLFFKNAYSWSYVEKARNMESRADIAADFRRLYARAARFRFKPDYSEFAGLDASKWTSELAGTLQPVHLAVESARLQIDGLTWAGYRAPATAAALKATFTGPLSAARAAVRVARDAIADPVRFNPKSSMIPDSMKIALVFPPCVYDLVGRERDAAAAWLESDSAETINLRRAYLRRWGKINDPNFGHAARRMGLKLD